MPDSGDIFTIPGTMQALVQPNQAGMVDYGANIRYAPPAKNIDQITWDHFNLPTWQEVR